MMLPRREFLSLPHVLTRECHVLHIARIILDLIFFATSTSAHDVVSENHCQTLTSLIVTNTRCRCFNFFTLSSTSVQYPEAFALRQPNAFFSSIKLPPEKH